MAAIAPPFRGHPLQVPVGGSRVSGGAGGYGQTDRFQDGCMLGACAPPVHASGLQTTWTTWTTTPEPRSWPTAPLLTGFAGPLLTPAGVAGWGGTSFVVAGILVVGAALAVAISAYLRRGAALSNGWIAGIVAAGASLLGAAYLVSALLPGGTTGGAFDYSLIRWPERVFRVRSMDVELGTWQPPHSRGTLQTLRAEYPCGR